MKALLKKFIRSNSFFFGIGHVGFLLGRLLRDVILARLVGSQMFGVWAAFNVLRQYGAYSDLGLFNGLSREIPRIKEDYTLTRRYCGIAAAGTFISTSLLVVWFYFFKSAEFVKDRYSHAMIVLMLVFVGAEKIYKYYHSVFLGFSEVKKAGFFLFFLSFLDVALAVGGAYLWGLFGVLVGTSLAVAITAGAMSFFSPVKVLISFSKPATKALISSSILLMCFGLMNVALKNMDRTIFVYLKGDESVLGAHHAASLVALSIGIVPFILISVINPKLYSLHADHNWQFIDILKKYGTICCASGCLVGLSVYALSPYVIDIVFPHQPLAKVIVPYLIVAEIFIAASLVLDAVIVVKNRGVFILLYKFAVLLTIMLGQVLYIKKGGEFGSSINLAVMLSRALMFVHLFCFLGSFVYLIFLIRKGTDLRKIKFIFSWPLLIMITMLIIV
ncbi:MAG: lipopolysaccharide biosynthesis protein [Bdellovibrio sp.]